MFTCTKKIKFKYIICGLVFSASLAGCNSTLNNNSGNLLKPMQEKQNEYSVEGYNKNTALLVATVADAVFRNDYGKSGFARAGVEYDGYFAGNEGLVDLQFAYGHRGNINGNMDIFISIRGSKENIDWITDLHYLAAKYNENIDSKITVHAGFINSANFLEKQEGKAKISSFSLLDLINQNISGTRNDKFFITGHSLGGAVATLYTTKLFDRGLSREKMVTFTYGAPPVSMDEGMTKERMNSLALAGKAEAIKDIAKTTLLGNESKAVNYYIERYFDKVQIFRIYDSNDIVPKLIPPARHLGTPVMYQSKISAKELLDKNKHLQLHLMNNYFNLIQNTQPLDPATKTGGLIDLVF